MAKKKKTYYKKKYKGVRYINSSLKKYFGKKYPDTKLRQARAREIFNQLKQGSSLQDQKVILANIFPLERRSRQSRRTEQDRSNLLPDFLKEPQYYFYLTDYASVIDTMLSSSGVTFQSEISPAGLPNLKAGTDPNENFDITYEEYFADFVEHCNDLKKKSGDNQYNIDWQVMCTVPDENLVSTIISCDINEQPVDYGFDPENPKQRSAGPQITQPAPEPQAPSEQPPTRTGQPTAADLSMQEKLNRAKELELRESELKGLSADQKFELLKQERAAKAAEKSKRQDQVTKLLDMFSEGMLTKAEFKDMMNRLP
jgi:hypothetical protein